MNPDPSRAEALFLAAVEIAASQERSAFLDRECGDDLALRARVDALLAAHDRSGDFLRAAAPSPEMAAEFARLKPEEAGERIGHYRLLQPIGEGGFGVVWMAEQEQPVRRRVALKIIKLGMDTKEVIARFEQERQALAMMDHPSIAKVFDAGATPFGRPYFVMELVCGVKLTDYCDEARLPTAERLQLFIAVCQAVHHAHQKGIIHRDLKPSNILVTLHDGVPVPKVIDFGVAKAIQQRLTERTLFTQFEQMIGTPLYMSPEQAELSGLDIDTRSDIYSLGVLLYELLTGRTPVDAETLQRAGLDEVRRIIREEEPLRPSMARSRGAPALSTSPGRNSGRGRPFSSDLDWIVLKALEKDRTRRYDTASAFALDVRRFLDDEPVSARPPSAGYRFRKFSRRHRLALQSAAAIAAVLIVAAVGGIWLAVRAIHAEHRASERATAEATARQEAEAVTTFLTTIFQSPDPARDGSSITVAQTLDHAVRRLDTDLATQPERQAQLREVLSRTYHALGLHDAAIPLQEQARDAYVRILGPEHLRTLDALHNLANCYSAAGRREDALRLREQVLALRRKVHGPIHPDTLRAVYSLAKSYDGAARHGESIHLQEAVLALCLEKLGPERSETLATLHNLASSYAAVGRHPDALQLRERVFALRRKVSGPEHPDTLRAMDNLVDSYADVGRREDALALAEALLALRRKVLGSEHAVTLSTLQDLARLYHDFDRPDDALRLRQEGLALSRKMLGPEHSDTLDALHNLAHSYDRAGRPEEAIPLIEEELALRRKVNGPEHRDTLKPAKFLASCYHHAGRGDEALTLREKVLALSRTIFGPEHRDTLGAMNSLAASYASTGRLPEAIDLQEETLEIERRTLPQEPSSLAVAMDNLATYYHAAGRSGEARTLGIESTAVKAQALGSATAK